jgi:hypothetical protein
MAEDEHFVVFVERFHPFELTSPYRSLGDLSYTLITGIRLGC